MKLGRRSRWIIILVMLIISSTVFLVQVDSVQATFSDLHAGRVLLRVEAEIMQKTPVGRYYDSLFWKHFGEVSQILNANPEHGEVLLSAIRLFIPELEAFLEGEGDTAYVASEHVEALKAELGWFASIGSPALKEDIEREQQRLPLDDFVGMTMNDAWDFINSKWTPEVIQPTATPEVIVQTITTPYVVDKTLVPGSDEEWAYYVHNGVYLEYPVIYSFKINDSLIAFTPSTDISEQREPYEIHVRVGEISAFKLNRANLLARYHLAEQDIEWTRFFSTEEVDGIEFVINQPSMPDRELGAILYNRNNQLAVEIFVPTKERPDFPDPFDYFAMINQSYPYFQHMVDNIRMQTP